MPPFQKKKEKKLEIKGSLDVAIDWAKKAKALGDKKANSYISILNKRKQDQVKLNKQLNN